MVYKNKNLPQLWEECISKNGDESPIFHNVSVEHALATAKCNIEEHLLTKPFEEYVSADAFPIPSAQDREGYCVGHDAQYWMFGLSDYLKIQHVAKKHEIHINKYFDFGCASGRVIRHFLCQSNTSEIWGSDINYNHIQWINNHLPDVKAVFNHTIPCLPLEDNYFDVVSAFSVFTHIDTFEIGWLCELRRILKPGGIAYITYHDENTWTQLKDRIDDPSNRVITTLKQIDCNVQNMLHDNLPTGKTVFRHSSGPYRSLVYHGIDYIKNVWGRFFTVVEIIPEFHAKQATIILKK